jgi:D-sedoheptulose 7-phosphate isomerase
MIHDARALVSAHLEDSARVTHLAVERCAAAVAAAADVVADALGAGGKVLLCGNGGSAADCQHVAAELVSRLTRDFDRPGLPAIALTTDTSFLTGFANDVGFEGVFARQVQALGKPGDVLVAISTSGTSANVLRAVETATARGMATVALTGRHGLRDVRATVTIAVPSDVTSHIQETHLALEHALCDLIERALFGDREPDQSHGGSETHPPIPPAPRPGNAVPLRDCRYSESGGQPSRST